MGQGQVGSWRQSFSPELNERFNAYCSKWFADTDLPYRPEDL